MCAADAPPACLQPAGACAEALAADGFDSLDALKAGSVVLTASELSTKYSAPADGAAGLAEAIARLVVAVRASKPAQNVLLDGRGYGVIVDFGFAKVLDAASPRTHTQCGTPEYLAPEIIDRREHGYVAWEPTEAVREPA